MFKYVLYLLAIMIAVGLAVGGIHLYRVAVKNKKEMAAYEGPAAAVERRFGRVLVVYYSLSGHTREIAEKIKALTGGDIYEIKTAEEIKTTPWFYLTLRRQIKEKNYPVLAGKLPDLSRYDIIFVGAPVWWYTMATPLSAFLEQVDFQGRKVVPFSTQGSNYGSYFEDFTTQAKHAEIQRAQSFNNLPAKYDEAVDNKIVQWLNNL